MTVVGLKAILRKVIAENADGLTVKGVSVALRELDEELHQITDQVVKGNTVFGKYVLDIHGVARETD